VSAAESMSYRAEGLSKQGGKNMTPTAGSPSYVGGGTSLHRLQQYLNIRRNIRTCGQPDMQLITDNLSKKQ
jgi:hypothetical protein